MHRNAVTTAVKRVAGARCVTEAEKREVLRADLERNVILCLHNSMVISSEANEICLEKLLEISWRAALQRYFDGTMHEPATVAAYLAYPCARTDLQVRLAWCLLGIKKLEYEANRDSKSKEQELEFSDSLG